MDTAPFAALPTPSPRHAFRVRGLGLALLGTLLSACASTHIPQATVTQSEPEALALVTASQRAHGSNSFAAVRDLNLRAAGTWSWLGPRLHRKLCDPRFVRESEIALDLAGGTIVELHKGRGGRKFVFRGAGRMALWYNGQTEGNEESIRAAALTADLGKMAVLGPLYFQRPGITLEKAGTAKVDGAECDQVLAVLRPGFGYAEEDRVVLSIDQKTQRLRRATFTLNGLLGKKPGEMDVTFSGWAERSGMWWATDYQERFLGRWLKLSTHHWKLLDVKVNKGFLPKEPELLGEAISEAVSR
jgi:hypothetical protein